tara:strand:- start:488 stop:1243 length:756 start_codon:yes stop_codon:yes gene_type:complete
MIISYSNNFVFIRTPRAAGTSMAFYLFKSGLIDPQTDIYKVEGSFSAWEDFDQFISTDGLEFANLPKELKSLESMAAVRRTFDDLGAKSAIQADMPCIATIRNPIERMASGYAYICRDTQRAIDDNNGAITSGVQWLIDNVTPNVNMYWDAALAHYNGSQPMHKWYTQSHYFPDHAEVFNIENLHQHASKFISEKGGTVSEPIELRRNTDIFTPDQTETVFADLTADRRQAMTDLFAKDFEIWERSYAVYN